MSEYTLGFNVEDPIGKLYQKLKEDGIQDADLDFGYPKTDYVKKERAVVHQGDRVIQEQEVLNYALDRYEKYQAVIQQTTGYLVPWSLDDLSPIIISDDQLRERVNQIISDFKARVVSAGYPEGTDRHDELLGVALYAFVMSSKKKTGQKYKVPEDVRKELEEANLRSIAEYLQMNGGLGFMDIGKDCSLESTALEALKQDCGACTERSAILFVLFKIAGLKVEFIFGVPSHVAVKKFQIGGESFFHNAIKLVTKKDGRYFDAAVPRSDAEPFYKENFDWWFDQTVGEQLASYYVNLGVTYGQSGKLDSAIAECLKALKINPDDVAAHTNLGSVYRLSGKLDSAIAEFQKVIAINPNYAEAHNNLGAAYVQSGKLDSAIAEFQKVIVINPDSAEAHYNLGLVYVQSGKIDLGIAEYQKAITINPNDAETHTNLGLTYVSKGGKLKDDKNKKLELYQQGLEELNKAAILGAQVPQTDLEKIQWRIDKLQEDIAKTPSQKLCDMADKYYQENDLVRALASYQKGLAEDPRSEMAALGIWNTYKALEDSQNAKKACEVYVKLSGETISCE